METGQKCLILNGLALPCTRLSTSRSLPEQRVDESLTVAWQIPSLAGLYEELPSDAEADQGSASLN